MSNNFLIRDCEVYTPDNIIPNGFVKIQNGKIQTIGVGDYQKKSGDEFAIINAHGSKVIPGFIDTHVHGRDGFNFGDDIESTRNMLKTITQTGVTSLLPTLGARREFEQILEGIDNIIVVKESNPEGAVILGVHMEGPSFSKEKIARGSQPVDFFLEPRLSNLQIFFKHSKGNIKKLSIAPELPGAIEYIKAAHEMGIIVCAGHSAATYEEAIKGIENGVTCATHTFNGMLPLHHRNPGLIGAILTRDEVNAEFIPDGQHISPIAIQILARCKGIDQIHAVSDNTTFAGLPNGEYIDSERNRIVIKDDNRAYVKGGTLAGSVCPLILGFGVLINGAGFSIHETIKVMSFNPAKLLGIDHLTGSIETGKNADLLILDDKLNIMKTLVNGKIEFDMEQ